MLIFPFHRVFIILGLIFNVWLLNFFFFSFLPVDELLLIFQTFFYRYARKEGRKNDLSFVLFWEAGGGGGKKDDGYRWAQESK